MDITVTHPETKVTTAFKQLDSQVAAVLIAAGIATPFYKPAEPAPASPWGVSKGRFDDHPFIIWRQGTQEHFFDGPPERAFDFKPRGEAPPDHIIAAYAALKKQNGNVPVSQDVVAFYRTQNAKEPPRAKRDWE